MLVENIGASGGKEFEVKESMGRFTMAMIASCAFGVDVEAFNRDSQFIENAKGIFK